MSERITRIVDRMDSEPAPTIRRIGHDYFMFSCSLVSFPPGSFTSKAIGRP
jgi:hypothetical protein